jgi:hypothetical protein
MFKLIKDKQTVSLRLAVLGNWSGSFKSFIRMQAIVAQVFISSVQSIASRIASNTSSPMQR